MSSSAQSGLGRNDDSFAAVSFTGRDKPRMSPVASSFFCAGHCQRGFSRILNNSRCMGPCQLLFCAQCACTQGTLCRDCARFCCFKCWDLNEFDCPFCASLSNLSPSSASEDRESYLADESEEDLYKDSALLSAKEKLYTFEVNQKRKKRKIDLESI